MGGFKARRMSRKPQKSQYFRFRRRPSIWFLVSVIIIAILLQGAWLVDANIRPMLVVMAKAEVKKVAQEAMLKGIRGMQKSLGDDLDHTLSIERGSTGQITFVRVNTEIQTRIYAEMTSYIQEELNRLRERNIGLTVGQILQSNLFSHYGPEIPLKLWPKGSTQVSIVPKLESQGINMTMVTLNIEVKNDMEMIVPFSKDIIPVFFQYPIAQAIVVGEVPEYYFYNDQEAVKQGRPIVRPSMPSGKNP